jgi:hypothetical protein
MSRVIDFWRQFEGSAVEGVCTLLEFCSGSETSAVFRAEAGGPEPRTVSVKLIHAGQGAAEDFLSRWEAAGRLDHPNLARISGCGRCTMGDFPFLYLITEYPDEDLEQVLRQRPLTETEARQMLESVLPALRYLHEHGFVHGSLKPANILAVGERIKLSADSVRKAGENPAPAIDRYAPAEAAAGICSPEGDVWSLGITLHEVLTHQLPRFGRDGVVRWNDTLPVPAPLAAIINGTLAVAPHARWTLRQIETALDNYESLRPLTLAASAANATGRDPAQRPTRDQRVRPPSGRKYGLLAAGLAAVVLLVLFAAKSFRSVEPPAAPPPRAAAPAPKAPAIPPAAAVRGDGAVVGEEPAFVKPRPSAFKPPSVAAQPGWRVIVYTYGKRDSAEQQATAINRKWPNLKAEVHPSGDGRHHMVTIGGQMSREQALRLQQQAKDMGLPPDTVARRL